MNQKIIFRKAGKRTFREIDSDEFKLYKAKGRPKTIMHRWLFDMICENNNVEFDKIMQWSVVTRKDILKEYYGKEYIDPESCAKLFDEIEKRNIPMPYGN